MDFKVDYIKLDDIGFNIINKSEDLKHLFEDLEKIILDLEEDWSGNDYESFKNVAVSYIKSLSITTNELDYIGKFMRKASLRYSNNDESFSKNITNIGEDEDWKVI